MEIPFPGLIKIYAPSTLRFAKTLTLLWLLPVSHSLKHSWGFCVSVALELVVWGEEREVGGLLYIFFKGMLSGEQCLLS